MLINASHEEESRVAIVHGEYLQELDIESAQKALTKGNIYKGTITKVEASLQAAFVEYGSNRQGFLSLSEIHPDYWKEGVDKTLDPRKVNIQDVLERKQSILVQVVKEERGNKGAALTTVISLAGRYLVLSPNTTRGGISRKLSDDVRRAMKEVLSQLQVPDNMGLIVRTAGKDQTFDSLERDYSYLRRLWDEIRIKGESAPTPSLIYLEGDLATRAIRDHFTDDISEIWVDNHEIYTRTKEFVHAVLPGKEKLVKLYRGKKPLFRHYGIEPQCEEIHEREIRLPSGGSIVFDPTEALTSIDVNSSRATKGKHIDDTALATNLEAAEEVARQLRIRDIGGLIVIDFIDMASRKHAQQVEEQLRLATKADKARIQLARISRFGLLEMSRQRLHPSVRETTSETCPRCTGRGHVLTVESMALQMLTRMEDLAEAGKKPTLVVQVPSNTGEYLMNNKRDNIARIEENYDVQITLQIRPELVIPHYRIERHWNEENQQRVEVLEDTTKGKKQARSGRKLKPLKPVVGIPPAPDSRRRQGSSAKSWWLSLIESIFGNNKKKKAGEKDRKRSESRGGRRRDQSGRNRNRQARDNQPRARQDADQPQQDARPGEEKKRRPRRRNRQRPRQEADPSQQTEEKQLSDGITPVESGSPEKSGDTTQRSKKRRRRRRPSSGNGSSENSQENRASQSESEGSEQRPVTVHDDAPKAEQKPESKHDDTPKAEKKSRSKRDDAPKAEKKPESKRDDAPKAEKKSRSKRDDAPKAEQKPESNHDDTPKIEQKPENTAPASTATVTGPF
ncbi:MAG: Rne/Rng family ribonuclease [Mariprofundaceae bacterium]|nr:Rne/Rng family ribonuclease [Mariprofundaceae bacterium]